jgi:hypothetical protein
VAEPWRSRIVGHGEEAPDQLLANPRNWRLHPKGQQDALAGVLDEVGWVQDVIVNKTTGHVVDGHARVSIAISRREPSVPVVYVELSEEEEAKVLATFDPLGAMAGADAEALDALLEDVRTDDAALRSVLDGMTADGPAPPDPLEEWRGMPAFEHEDQTADGAFIIRVFLKDEAALQALGAVLGKDLTGRKFVWFGKQPLGTTYEAFDGPEPGRQRDQG